MQTNKKSKNIINIIQSFLILILVVLIIFMMIQISRLQGTARVINYAGLVWFSRCYGWIRHRS